MKSKSFRCLSFALCLTTVVFLCCGCGPRDKKSAYNVSDSTYVRIAYTLESEKHKDVPRYTSTVTAREGVVIGMEMAFHYYQPNEICWGDERSKYYTEDMVHCLLMAVVIPFTEVDGTVNDYILYSIYDNSLANYFGTYCDGHPGEQITITWYYDTHGNRVIDEYDVELAKPEHLKFWTMQNENHGVVPPIWEYDMGLTGELPTYYDDDQSAIDTAAIKELYPDVKPYGIDYPVEE